MILPTVFKISCNRFVALIAEISRWLSYCLRIWCHLLIKVDLGAIGLLLDCLGGHWQISSRGCSATFHATNCWYHRWKWVWLWNFFSLTMVRIWGVLRCCDPEKHDLSFFADGFIYVWSLVFWLSRIVVIGWMSSSSMLAVFVFEEVVDNRRVLFRLLFLQEVKLIELGIDREGVSIDRTWLKLSLWFLLYRGIGRTLSKMSKHHSIE